MYMYNVWVNWVMESDDHSSFYHAFEWKESDKMKKVFQMPIIYVKEQLFDTLCYKDAPLPRKLKRKIYHESFYLQASRKVIYQYACIICDKSRTLAIQWNKRGLRMRKSYLLPHQDRYIMEKGEHCQSINMYGLYLFWHTPQQLCIETLGLTRKEREKRETLLKIYDEMNRYASHAERLYWLKEWHYGLNRTLSKSLPINQLWIDLRNKLQSNWTENHELFFQKWMKYNLEKRNLTEENASSPNPLLKGKKCYGRQQPSERE